MVMSTLCTKKKREKKMCPLHLCLFNDVYVDCKYIAFIWYTNVDDNSCLSFFLFLLINYDHGNNFFKLI